mgnify:CR=1 FL=1
MTRNRVFPWVSRGALLSFLLVTGLHGQEPKAEEEASGRGVVIIASKHQSFLDIILIFGAVPAGKFIMKRELLWDPCIDVYGQRLPNVFVRRDSADPVAQIGDEQVALL